MWKANSFWETFGSKIIDVRNLGNLQISDLDIDKVHHDDVIKWKLFPSYWPFVRGIHRSPVNSPHKGQWRGALMFSLICVWINDWVNNGEAGDLRRYRIHYDVTVMIKIKTSIRACTYCIVFTYLHISDPIIGLGISCAKKGELVPTIIYDYIGAHKYIHWWMCISGST